MWSRREQHQAYKFLTRRIVSAVLFGEPETNELPMRRFGMALFSGIGLAVLVVAGFVVFGLMFPGGGKPEENVFILERETGTIYVYSGGELHQVLNWASAYLILGQAEVKTMSRTSLRDVPRGAAVGIPGAPQVVPRRDELIGLPWTACSTPRSAGRTDHATHVLPGSVPAGGRVLPADQALLVQEGQAGPLYLIWDSHRLEVPAGGVALPALRLAGVRPLTVTAGFLQAVPGGPKLEPVAVPDDGRSTTRTYRDGATAHVGDLRHDALADVYYVMTAAGLEEVGHVTATLWRAQGRAARPIDASEVTGLLRQDRTRSIEPEGMPPAIPTALGRADAIDSACAVYQGDPDPVRAVTVHAYRGMPEGLPTIDTPPTGTLLADRVAMPGNRGALVTPVNGAVGQIYLVAGGVKYPVVGEKPAEVKDRLGYAGVDPVPVTTELLDLIPTGVPLDPDDAAELAPAPTAP